MKYILTFLQNLFTYSQNLVFLYISYLQGFEIYVIYFILQQIYPT
ncbi:hypothetical protein SAMN02745170_02952 [Propionispora hippei DSM 15287]|uniref:Uncharacterized protein n=1 Tax=Propionispora hippei DSM 15287 TaxID=1123003 RepID=A0A1M6KU32_9FIRM|nr:hypothetical protein SAMN02745170_02952 [Propionispora hippei DSM 15287]